MAAVGIVFPLFIMLSQIQSTELLSQAAIDKIAYDLRIFAEVVENTHGYHDITHTVRIILGNYELDPIPCCDWVLYFHSFYLLFPGNTVNDFPQTKEKVLHDQNIIVRMIQGDLYSIEPVVGFGDIVQGEWAYVTLTAQHSSVSRSDFMPNWYISQKTEIPGVWPAIVHDTKTLNFVRGFYYPQQWKRYPADRYDPISPKVRNYRLGVNDKKQLPPPKLVIPTPVRLRFDNSGPVKFLAIDEKWRIQMNPKVPKDIVQFLSENLYVRKTFGKKKSKVIILAKGNIGSERESYKINVDTTKEIVKVTGKDNVGLFNGIQSVLSLVDSHFGMAIPNVEIHDYPRYSYRGFLLDVARNFHPVADVKRVIEAMSTYKLNKLILHLSDDEGWRVPVAGVPELTEIGGRRCHDLNETECIIPQLGSGPFDDTSGSGSYTEVEYQEILTHSKKHYIEVIPEIDAPGHAHAAIRAMEVRFIRERDDEYRLIDPLDKSFHISTQHWFDNVMNPCLDSTYAFIERAITRIMKLHRRIQPLRVFSIRGDEVPDGAWTGSPACNKLLRRFPKYKKPEGLKRYFAEKVASMTKRHGLTLQASEDLFLGEKDQPFKLKRFNNKIMVVARRNIWEQNKAHLAYRLANQDYKVIMAQATHLYLDHPYEPNPEEPGLYWATRFTDTRKVFSFKPDDLYENIDMSLAGKPLTYQEVCGRGIRRCEQLRNTKRKNIIGMQAHLWTETVRDGKRLDYMAFPRLLAFAERAWAKGKFEFSYIPLQRRKELEESDWEDFANTLGYKELWRLDNMGVKYRIPPPGASVMNDMVRLSVSYPGLVPQFSYDNYNTEPKTWHDAEGPFPKYNRTILLRTKSATGDRHSRVDYLS